MTKKSNLPPIVATWRKEAKRRGSSASVIPVMRAKECSGMSYQIPPDVGPSHLRRVQSGPEKGRICWTTREEAREAGKWIGEATGQSIRYDPD